MTMRRAPVFVLSFIVWCLLAWPWGGAAQGLDGQIIIVGLGAALLVALLFPDGVAENMGRIFNPVRWFWMLCYIPVFAYYCLKANLEVAYLVLHPDMPIHPGIVKVRTVLKGKSALTALANSITLTPGTLTVDASEDGVLYIHWLNVKATDDKEATAEIVGKFEGLLGRIFD